MMSVLVIYNQKAGQGERFAQVRQAFEGAKIKVEYQTLDSNPTDIITHSSADVVVAAGGDGTVNAVASVLAQTGRTMGIIPIGTLNHFAKDLGIPVDISASIATILQGRVAEVDAACVNDQLFVNNSSLGVYPVLVREREKKQSKLGKWLAVLAAIKPTLHKAQAYNLTLTLNDQVYHRRSPFLFVGNNKYQFDKLTLAGRKSLNEGLLHVYCLSMPRFFGNAQLLWRQLFKQQEYLETFIAKSVNIEVSNYTTLQVAFDGEVKNLSTPLNYLAAPKSLRVLVPRN